MFGPDFDKLFSPRPLGTYRVYGLVVVSELALPELSACADEVPGERVFVLLERCGANSRSDLIRGSSDRGQRIRVLGLADYYVCGDCVVIVELAVGVEINDAGVASSVRAYLLGSVLAAILFRKNWLPLHVSAVSDGSRLLAFTGVSGAGKSTMAMALHRTGRFQLYADDVLAVEPVASGVRLHPGPRRCKLWKDALDRFSIDPAGLVRDVVRFEKYHVSMGDLQFQPSRIDVLIVLKDSNETSGLPVRLFGRNLFKALVGAIYRPELISPGGFGSIFGLLGRVGASVRVHEYCRPKNHESLEVDIGRVAALMSEVAEDNV